MFDALHRRSCSSSSGQMLSELLNTVLTRKHLSLKFLTQFDPASSQTGFTCFFYYAFKKDVGTLIPHVSPDCLSRENGLGKPGLHRSNFGGISGRKDACDFPKPFHTLWQNSKFVNIIFLPFDMEFFLAMLISNIPIPKKINIPRVFKWHKHFHVK